MKNIKEKRARIFIEQEEEEQDESAQQLELIEKSKARTSCNGEAKH